MHKNIKKLAWERGGRNIRSRSQVIIDDSLLIDLPSDTFYHAMLHNIDLSNIHHCLITHIHREHFDMVSLDCTMGANEHTSCKVHKHFGHNVECRNRMLEMGIADENTKFISTHFSHNGLHGCYDDFLKIASKEGFDVSFDGMEIKL